MGILKLAYFALRSYSTGVIFSLSDPVTWILVLIVISLYRRNMPIQRVMYGKNAKHPLRELVITSILYGLIAGLIGTVIITLMGITFYELSGFMFVIIVTSLFLMLINPRYLCLSYSGGLWSIFILIISDLAAKGVISNNNFLFGFVYKNMKFDVPALMAIVAVLHLVEALLMLLDGHRGAIPVFMKRNGRVIGAFVMQRFWVLPSLIFIFSTAAPGTMGDTVSTPPWWPLIKPDLTADILKNAVYMAAPFMILLGYGDMAISTEVRSKTRRSAAGLLIFSILLLALAALGTRYHIFQYAAAFFAPIAHDAVIYIETKRERLREPLWQYTDRGIIVLDTMPESPSEAMGIKSGEIVVGINNLSIKTMQDAEAALSSYPAYIWVDVEDGSGKRRTLEYRDYLNGVRNLGIITVPQYDLGLPTVEDREGFISRHIKKIKR